MKIIVDSGSTKTVWRVVRSKTDFFTVNTNGMNPVRDSEEAMSAVVSQASSSMPECSIDQVFFYGAGCVEPFSQRVRQALAQVFPQATIHVESDLLGAAHALFGHQPGIACILGTGSNTCLYDGKSITDNIPPLGYILGDEGSGYRNFSQVLSLTGGCGNCISEACLMRLDQLCETLRILYGGGIVGVYIQQKGCVLIGFGSLIES